LPFLDGYRYGERDNILRLAGRWIRYNQNHQV